MKKRNRKITFFVVTILLAIFVMLCVLYFGYQLPKIHDESLDPVTFITYTIIFVLGCFTLLVLIGMYFLRINSKEHKLDRKLAYWNTDLNVYNNNMFEIKVKKRMPRLYNKSAIMTFNIIDFKNFTTQFGYSLGEMMLKSVARVLRERYDSSKVVYAYDVGDAFLVYLSLNNEVAYANEAVEIEEKIKKFVFEMGLNIEIKLAFGICPIDDKSLTFDEHLRRANTARMSIRSDKADRIIFFSESLLNSSADDKNFSAQIELAFANKEFEVYYQPKFDIKMKRFTSAEALIRWNHPQKGIIRPGTFIPFMERTGQVVKTGRYVFENVCRDLSIWKKNGDRLLPISINISRVELYQSDLLDFFAATIRHYNINPLLIEIELTESFASRDLSFAKMMMKKIRALRFKVSMDDFGTGYSSLSCLKDMPIDVLKLDKSFFDDVEIDARSRDIVTSIIELSRALGLYTVAEGIQSEKQIQFLKSTKCDSIQGYYYSEAIKKEDFEQMLRKNKFEDKEKN